MKIRYTPICLVIILFVANLAAISSAQEDARANEIQRLADSLAPIAITGPPVPPTMAKSLKSEGRLRERAGILLDIIAPHGYHFPVGNAVRGKPGQTALNFVRGKAALLGTDNPKIDFELKKEKQSEGSHSVRLRQRYAGLRVFGAEIVTRINDRDGLEYLLSDISTKARLLDPSVFSTKPSINQAQAGVLARQYIQEKYPKAKLSSTEPELMLFDPEVLGTVGDIRLAWELRIAGGGSGVLLHERVLLDAIDGTILRHYPGAIMAREIYNGDNQPGIDFHGRPIWGTLIRSEGEPASGDAQVDTVYDYLGDVYNYFRNNHGRYGMDGLDSAISATVRFCTDDLFNCPMPNAFYWDGDDRIYIGDGFNVDDIIAHEYAHGVTRYESELIYENHSGAINESFSDLWGEFVDRTNARGNDAVSVRWLIGEDRATGASRNMANPPEFDDPDRMSSPFLRPVETFPDNSNDYGGVHHNSGVNNKLVYLLTQGDSFNGQTVSAMGMGRVAALYYEANRNHLSQTADYYDLATALYGAADVLGWSIDEVINLDRACAAVGILNLSAKIFVDWTHTGTSDGSIARPFRTVAEGYSAAGTGDDLMIRSGNYSETLLLEKSGMLIRRWGGSGSVVIGH